MKVEVKVLMEGQVYALEGEANDMFKRDMLNIINASVPQLQLKFGDSGNVVMVALSKVKDAAS